MDRNYPIYDYVKKCHKRHKTSQPRVFTGLVHVAYFFAKNQKRHTSPETLDFTGFFCGTFFLQKRHKTPQTHDFYADQRIFEQIRPCLSDLLDIHAKNENSPFSDHNFAPKWVTFENSPFLGHFSVLFIMSINLSNMDNLLSNLHNDAKIKGNFVAFFNFKNATKCHKRILCHKRSSRTGNKNLSFKK